MKDHSSPVNDVTSNQIRAQFILTANHGFASYAQEEIRKLFGSCQFKIIVPTEVLYVEVDCEKNEAIKRLKKQEPVFLRHVHPVDVCWDLNVWLDDRNLLTDWLMKQQSEMFLLGNRIAIQIRLQEKSILPFHYLETKALIEKQLMNSDEVQFVTHDAHAIISIYISHKQIYVGISKPQDNLSDWSGGAIRFMREENQISRAKFKLLEAEYVFGLQFKAPQAALDIGAAPGGWTSFLLERGLHVTAIDPADLHESLKENSLLTYYKKNASEVNLPKNQFDWLTCDMSFSPKQSIPILANFLESLKNKGQVVLTVKLMHKKPFQTIRDVLQLLEPHLKLIKAKQLFHNRDEITLYFIKN